MTDPKFTKGEWLTSYRKDSDGMYSQDVYDSSGKTICSCSWYQVDEGNGHTTTNREDNAHLIASAPAMYEALLAMSKGEGLQPGTTIESILIKARGELT